MNHVYKILKVFMDRFFETRKSENELLQNGSYYKILERARAFVRNEQIANAVKVTAETYCGNLVPDKGHSESKKAFNEWAKHAGYRSGESLGELNTDLVSILTYGDCLIVLERRTNVPKGTITARLKLIDPLCVKTPPKYQNKGLVGGKKVILGVAFDSTDMEMGYYVLGAGLGYAPVSGPKPDSIQGFFKHFFVVPPQGRNQRLYSAEERQKIASGYNANDIINVYLCVSQETGPYVRHARNVILKDFEIACSAKSVMQITASGPAERLDYDKNKIGVANWNVANGSFPENVFQLSDFKIYIGEGVLDLHSATDFSLKISHGLSDDNIPTGTSHEGLSRAEPMPSGKSTITLDMTIYLHDKTKYEEWQRNETKLQCKLVAQRGSYRFAILLPRVQLTNAQPNFDGAGSTALSFEVAWPCDAADQTSIENSFPEERQGMPWPQASVLGIVVTNKENRNPMRDMEITGQGA